MKETIILFFLFICFSCSVQKNNAQIKSDYIIPESYKEYNVVTKDHVLVLTKSNETTPKMPVKILEVVFYDTKTNEEFFKDQLRNGSLTWLNAVSYTHLRAHETRHDLVCRLLLEKKKQKQNYKSYN